MNRLSSLPIALLVAIATAGVTSADRHRLELDEHYHHLAYIADFPCHKPQPRVISVHELFSKSELHAKAYFPDVTVLHRCDDHAGCCTSGHHCKPVHVEHLHLPFKVTFLEPHGTHKMGSWILDYYHFDNHTECACVEHTPPHHEMCHTKSSYHPEEHYHHEHEHLPAHEKHYYEHYTPDHHPDQHHEEHHPVHHHEEHHPVHHHEEHKPVHHHEEHPVHHHEEHSPVHHHEEHRPDQHHEEHHHEEHRPSYHHEEHHHEEQRPSYHHEEHHPDHHHVEHHHEEHQPHQHEEHHHEEHHPDQHHEEHHEEHHPKPVYEHHEEIHKHHEVIIPSKHHEHEVEITPKPDHHHHVESSHVPEVHETHEYHETHHIVSSTMSPPVVHVDGGIKKPVDGFKKPVDGIKTPSTDKNFGNQSKYPSGGQGLAIDDRLKNPSSDRNTVNGVGSTTSGSDLSSSSSSPDIVYQSSERTLSSSVLPDIENNAVDKGSSSTTEQTKTDFLSGFFE